MITFPPNVKEVNYEQVETFTELPLPEEKQNEIVIVRTKETFLGVTTHKAGLYQSNGAEWFYIGNNVSIDDTNVSEHSVWSSNKVGTTIDSKIASDNSYIRAEVTSIAVGGAQVGSTFDGTVKDALDKILYPYKAPAFTSFYLEGVPSTYELGSTMEGGGVAFRWATSNSDNIVAGSITCNGVTGLNNTGVSVQTLASVTNSSVTTVSYSISGVNSNEVPFSRSTSLQWSLKRYFGVSSDSSLDDGVLLGLSNEFASSKAKTVVYDCTGGKYFYYAYPTSFGDLLNTKVNNMSWNDWVLVKREVVNSYGVAIPFNVYRSYNLLNGSGIQVVWG